jgi:hypothetical protein
MKFLTKEYILGRLSDAESEARWAAAQRHRNEILPALPDDARRLLEEVPFHDAQVENLIVDEPRSEVLLRLLGFSMQDGPAHYRIAIVFGGAYVVEVTAGDAQRIVCLPRAEIVETEIDLVSEGVEIRFGFARSGEWFGVRFKSVSHTKERVSDRFARPGVRFKRVAR